MGLVEAHGAAQVWTDADRPAPRVVHASAGAVRWQRAPVWLRNDAAAARYRERRIRRWEALACMMDRWRDCRRPAAEQQGPP